jgi:hypothetical protein
MDLVKCTNPDFCSKRKIDIILGSEIFFELFFLTQMALQKTVFGWILSGIVTSNNSIQRLLAMNTETESLHFNQIKSFWEIEEVVKYL